MSNNHCMFCHDTTIPWPDDVPDEAVGYPMCKMHQEQAIDYATETGFTKDSVWIREQMAAMMDNVMEVMDAKRAFGHIPSMTETLDAFDNHGADRYKLEKTGKAQCDLIMHYNAAYDLVFKVLNDLPKLEISHTNVSLEKIETYICNRIKRFANMQKSGQKIARCGHRDRASGTMCKSFATHGDFCRVHKNSTTDMKYGESLDFEIAKLLNRVNHAVGNNQ